MNEIARVIAQLVPASRLSETTVCSHDIRGWIATQQYRISSDIGRDNFTLDASCWSGVERALGIEANRFFIGAIESADGVCRQGQRALWVVCGE